VPVFLVHRADVPPTGDVPTVLWGYGGFDIPVTPAFRPAWRAWVDAGGLLAVACLRGGGEYGRAWHDAGRGRDRPAVQADALAVAAWLTGGRREDVRATTGPATEADAGPDVVWSAPAHLGVEGRSNGGLLVGTCITAEPDRFASAVPEVGVLDLLRFHRFTIGWAWTSDYGSPDDPDAFVVLHGLSPYHRALTRDGVAYPATLVTTGDTDDRVVPAHSYKFAAALQAAQAGDAPVLLRVDVAAGHGAGKPVAKLLDERADVLAWHAVHLGLDSATPRA
jgi:prolyl oligopeptidase